MRISNSIKNSIATVCLNFLTILLGLIAQSIFIRILGAEYNGIKSLFSNIFSMLAIAELGFGSAIVYHLYKPISEKNIPKIKSLVNFYKNVYRIVAFIIFILGMIIIPFINGIVGETTITDNIHLIYILFLFETVASYLLTYKRSIVQSDQKNYIINYVNIFYLVIVNVIQIAILLISKNFIIYLIVKIILRILENLTINVIVNKKYPYLKEKDIEALDKNTKKEIYHSVNGLLFHKIGSFLVMGTDNILISILLGIKQVGLYTNYYMIINYVHIMFGQIFAAFTASIGNLLIEQGKERSHQIYKNMLFLNSWIYCFCAISIYLLMEPFISLWLGGEYILPKLVLITLAINFYVQGMRKTNVSFKDAAGIFYEDRFIPIIESIVNIIASVILVKYFGLAGIVIGTILSSLVLYIYSFPKFMYKKIFDKSYLEFYKIHMYYLLITLVTAIASVFIVSKISLSNVFLQLIVNGILCLIIPNLIYYLISRKKEEFAYFKYIVLDKIFKRGNNGK